MKYRVAHEKQNADSVIGSPYLVVDAMDLRFSIIALSFVNTSTRYWGRGGGETGRKRI